MFKTKDLSKHLGSEITGVDLSAQISSSLISDLLDLLNHRGVVNIPSQDLDIESFMRFSRALGPLAVHPLRKFSRPGFPELMINSNIIENGEPIGLADAGRHWHTDGAYLELPYRATILYAVEIPVRNGVALGNTYFASTSAAFNALDDSQKKDLSLLTAINRHGVARKKNATDLQLAEKLEQEVKKGIEHPVIRTHPFTGQSCIYVNPGCTHNIKQLDQAKGEILLNRLYEQITHPDWIYCHKWKVGDILMWDNCSTQHRAVGDYELPARRLLYRTLINGTKPFYKIH